MRLNDRCASCPLGPDCHNRRPGWGEYCGLMHRADVRAFALARTNPPDPKLAAFAASLPARDGRIGVALVAPVFFGCGAEEWTLAMARSLDPARFRVAGLAILNGEAATDPATVARARAILPVGFGRPAARALAGACDVVVGWDCGDLPAELAAVPGRPRFVLVSHAPPESDWGRHAMAQLAGVDATVAVSELAVATLPEGRRAGCRVIWNAVDASRLAPSRGRAEVRASWGVGPSDLVAGFYGRMSPEKGPDVLPGLARALPPPWHVVAVGNPDGRAAADAPNLHYPGPDPDAGSVLAAFDVLLSPSRFESFGLSMGEALHCGVPVLATPAGLGALAPEVVRVVPHGTDGAGWARAVLADWRDRAGRLARVARGRALAVGRLSLARFGAEWSDYLASLARPAPPPADARSAALARVASCPDRGPVLPISMQDDCGCRGKELSECRAGKGQVAGRVTLAECLQCRR